MNDVLHVGFPKWLVCRLKKNRQDKDELNTDEKWSSFS